MIFLKIKTLVLEIKWFFVDIIETAIDIMDKSE